MKSRTEIFILLSVIICEGSSKDFPENFKCTFEDSKCIKDKTNEIIKLHYKGSTDIGLISIDPLEITSLDIKQGAEGPINVAFKFTNSKLIGFNAAEVVETKGFGKDLQGPHEIHFKIPLMSLLGDYDVKGRILLLPIVGNGKSNITFINPLMKVLIKGKPIEKNGKTYMDVAQVKTKIIPARVVAYFGNLFNGDKTLGDNMNMFLNENWADIWKELKQPVEDTFTQIIKNILSNIYEKFSYDELYTK